MTLSTITPAMRKVLIRLRDGRDPTGHLFGRAAWGGWAGTRIALIRRGYMNATLPMKITDAGREALNVGESPK